MTQKLTRFYNLREIVDNIFVFLYNKTNLISGEICMLIVIVTEKIAK